MDMDNIVEMFHAMWDSFPSRVRLIRKDRTVLAVNRAAKEMGMEVGVRCLDNPPDPMAHAGCLANLALKEKTAKYSLTKNGKRLRFWIPVEGVEDVYVHFSIEVNDIK